MALVVCTVIRGENAVILKQKDAPLVITTYTTTYMPEYKIGSTFSREQIAHKLQYRNSSTKTIVAIRIGLATFDAFNDFMERFGGVGVKDILPGKDDKGEWGHSPYATFSFRKFGTGVAYVSTVRFDDGSFWNADINEVLLQLRNFQKDLQVKDLEEKKK
jgi:hypothetical protein